jgi:hypothetical protein
VSDIDTAVGGGWSEKRLTSNGRLEKQTWEEDYISENKAECGKPGHPVCVCDDGDMAFFNGLLCAAGESRGCNGVAIAQEEATGKQPGRWWRSNRLIGQPSDQAQFSTEGGLGVLTYMVKTGDKPRFDLWRKYLAGLARPCGPLPSYCPDKECVFKIIDCPLFVTIASRFDEAKEAGSLCDPLQYLHLPTPEQIKKQLENGLKQLIDTVARFEALGPKVADQVARTLGLPPLGQLVPTPTEELRKRSDAIFRAFDSAFGKIMGPQIGEAAARFAQAIVLVNAVVNSFDLIDVSKFKLENGKIVYDDGNVRVEDATVTILHPIKYNPNGEHIAAVEIFLLRNLGYHSEQLRQAASYAYQRDGSNPFFDYLVNQRTLMLDNILDKEKGKCPSLNKPSVKRFQWFPERGEELQPNGQTAWIESMYWDCIFLADLY